MRDLVMREEEKKKEDKKEAAERKRPRLVRIPDAQYSEYRYRAIFQAYKWDPQVADQNTVAHYGVVLSRDTTKQLETWAEQLTEETCRMEQSFLERPDLWRDLGLSRSIRKELSGIREHDPKQHVRLMRFDFHPTEDGFAVSEVNSDVPGGLAEASALPRLAEEYLKNCEAYRHTGQSLLEAFQRRVASRNRIAFVHATSYSDDRQVMEFLGDYFGKNGFEPLYAAPEHIYWERGQAKSRIQGKEGEIGGILRFFPLEWMENLQRKSDWMGYFQGQTPSCNHPTAIFTQSKRLPLFWEALGVKKDAWESFLPETCDPRRRKGEDWIYKPALGRVGEGISIREAVTEKEYRKIEKLARREPKNWILQKRFVSRPIESKEGERRHLCIGVFTVDGRAAGFYGRASVYPRIDDRAEDIPVLVEKEEENG